MSVEDQADSWRWGAQAISDTESTEDTAPQDIPYSRWQGQAGDAFQLVEHFPGRHEALASIPTSSTEAGL